VLRWSVLFLTVRHGDYCDRSSTPMHRKLPFSDPAKSSSGDRDPLGVRSFRLALQVAIALSAEVAVARITTPYEPDPVSVSFPYPAAGCNRSQGADLPEIFFPHSPHAPPIRRIIATVLDRFRSVWVLPRGLGAPFRDIGILACIVSPTGLLGSLSSRGVRKLPEAG